MSAINIHLSSFADNPIESAAQHIVAQQAQQLPLLTNIVVFTPQPHIATALRKSLLNKSSRQGHEALLGPTILTIEQWLQSFQPDNLNVISPVTQELILVEALLEHKSIFESETSPWGYAHNLLLLFRELTANKIELPNDEKDFIQQISQAYGINKVTENITIEALSREANFIFTLWHAWHNQLNAYDVIDSQANQLLCMQNSLKKINTKTCFYFIGYDLLTKTESQWLEQLSSNNEVHYFLQGQYSEEKTKIPDYHPDQHTLHCIQQFSDINLSNSQQSNSSRLDFLNTVYNTQTTYLLERAKSFSDSTKIENLINLSVYAASTAEQEARAIDIQLRRWLLQGKNNLAIVTEDRRLARRVRALLERSGVYLQDAAGWALSTTRTAATLERWLECIEQDFDYLALLDLLKSPFIFPQYDRETLHYAVYRLEQDIIRHENISQNLKAYRAGIKNREQRLKSSEWFKDTDSILLEILNLLEQAAEQLNKLASNESFTPQEFIQSILSSFENLGLDTSFEEDAAGIKILNLLDNLGSESNLVKLKFNWVEARAWLALQLERSRFMPPASGTQVQLIGLSQSTLQKFDGLIIAAVVEEFLPGSPTPSTFFNDAVNYELGLKTSLQEKNERYYHFMRLLNSADNVLLSYCNQGSNGETVKPSSWLALLEQFHLLVFNCNLADVELEELVNSQENTFTHIPDCKATSAQQPKPSLPENLIPNKISASHYQELVNCPYLFYAARCLKLEATDEIREALSKAEYGERIHLCLEAFHHPVNSLPGPFKNKLTQNNRDTASKLLHKIIDSVFGTDLDENHEHLAWYTQAKKIVPHYIEWQMEHNLDWDIYQQEEHITKELEVNNTHKPLKLSGRLDRIDKNNEGLGIIDYKTGAISSNKDVESGEQVQLPFYHALLDDDQNHVNQVEYLEVKSDKVQTKATLNGEQLETIANKSTIRLKEIFGQLHTYQGLPAWGDDKTCQRCNMQGICRKQMWETKT